MEQRQDLRSLATLRILSGIYIIYDILSRLQYGRISLLWYTSTENSFLYPDDTPHKSPIHQIWFYRGTEFCQVALFSITFTLAVFYMLGYKCTVISKTFLWINVVAMQCRCMPFHDGSDSFLRHLLLWSVQLPMSQVWSVDSILSKRSRNQEKRRDASEGPLTGELDYCQIQNRTAVWGLRLQIVLMYLGTVMHRTVDAYGIAIHNSKWLPPQLTAVYYALNAAFATRDSWLGNFVRSNLPITQFMTLAAILIEIFAPICCFIMGDKSHIPAFFLFIFHFGLLILINLPNWQLVGMLTTFVWVPSSVWNQLQWNLSLKFPKIFNPPQIKLTPQLIRKKDRAPHTEEAKGALRTLETKSNHHYGKFLTYFFFSYMLLDFAGNRKWIPKLDDGDIGEFLRFSQYWVMYSGPPSRSSQIMLTGTLGDKDDVNVWEWIKTGGVHVEIVDLENLQSDSIWTNMTHVYPSPRVERALSDWSRNNYAKTSRFLGGLCTVTPFSNFKITFQEMDILPPESKLRYSRTIQDKVVDVKCNAKEES